MVYVSGLSVSKRLALYKNYPLIFVLLLLLGLVKSINIPLCLLPIGDSDGFDMCLHAS